MFLCTKETVRNQTVTKVGPYIENWSMANRAESISNLLCYKLTSISFELFRELLKNKNNVAI